MRMPLLPCVVLLAAPGCHGPLTKPMVDRLEDRAQAKVDEVWAGMLRPPERLERTLLLDVILVGQLHQLGVNRLHMTSEKHVGDELVVMEVYFDRDDPAADEFVFAYVDADGNELRRERFSRAQVQERVHYLAARPHVDPDAPPAERAEMASRVAEYERRADEVGAYLAPLQSDPNVAFPDPWAGPEVPEMTPVES